MDERDFLCAIQKVRGALIELTHNRSGAVFSRLREANHCMQHIGSLDFQEQRAGAGTALAVVRAL